MPDLAPEALAALRALTPVEWDALTAQVRPPDRMEEFRSAAEQFVHHSGQLDTLCRFVDLANFSNDDGTIDPALVEHHLTRLLGPRTEAPTPTPPTPKWGRGNAGKQAAGERFGPTP